ncbi:MAG: serine hydrolase [Flavobacteriaceae bacterium]|nr:serine hydrolase [Flavobacteriaceae bacterium]
MNIKLLFWLALLFTLISKAQSKHSFSFTTPESKGFSSSKLEELKNHLELSGASSTILMVEGEIIFEWGNTRKRHLIHSMRKAMLNSLYGIAIHKGQIDTSMTLKEMKINDGPSKLSSLELNATIGDLLKSRSGIYHDAAAVNKAMLVNRPERGTHEPGAFFYYNNWDFNVLGTILERQTGKRIFQAFYEEIALPLGMSHYLGEYASIDGETNTKVLPNVDGVYRYEKSKSKHPAYHFRMSSRDLALYGQLYLNYGNWKGKQIIPKAWIDLSTKPISIYNPERNLAYGMLWRVKFNQSGTRNSFFHTGLGIHILGIYPDLKLVLVHRVDTEKDFQYDQNDFYKMLELVRNSTID